MRISKFIPNIGEETLAVLNQEIISAKWRRSTNFPRSAHAIANTDNDILAIDKMEMDKTLIMDRVLGYKLLWAFTRTRSKRLQETNDKMAGFLAMSGGF